MAVSLQNQKTIATIVVVLIVLVLMGFFVYRLRVAKQKAKRAAGMRLLTGIPFQDMLTPPNGVTLEQQVRMKSD